ncbi:MAG: potassium transporter, partial [Cycloclasticus sp.]
NDTFNLNMLHQANRLNPSVFSIVRQNQHANEILFKKADVDFILQPSLVIARMVLFMITAPLLRLFFKYLRLVYDNDPAKLADVTNRLSSNVGGGQPTIKTYVINSKTMPAVLQSLAEKVEVGLGDIYKDPSNRGDFLKMVPLVHKRDDEIKVMPSNELSLNEGDEILFCIRPDQKILFDANINNAHTLRYLLTGIEPARSSFFRWIERDKLENLSR